MNPDSFCYVPHWWMEVSHLTVGQFWQQGGIAHVAITWHHYDIRWQIQRGLFLWKYAVSTNQQKKYLFTSIEWIQVMSVNRHSSSLFMVACKQSLTVHWQAKIVGACKGTGLCRHGWSTLLCPVFTLPTTDAIYSARYGGVGHGLAKTALWAKWRGLLGLIGLWAKGFPSRVCAALGYNSSLELSSMESSRAS